jgi:hypothetical protein
MTYLDRDKLIGKEILDVVKTNEGIAILFPDNTAALFDVFGDCCSHSWVEDINKPYDVQGAKITKFEDKQLFSRNIHGGERRYYSMDIETTEGTISVEFRNDSNGYYGGSLEYRGIVKVEEEPTSKEPHENVRT